MTSASPAHQEVLRHTKPTTSKEVRNPADPDSPSPDRLTVLDRSQCVELLTRARIGRVATATDHGPVVVPVNFALANGDIVFVAGEGAKLEAARLHQVLGFEVDGFDPLYHTGWSVLVQGTAEEVTNPERLEQLRALALAPWAGGSRHCFVRLHIESISGRHITNDRWG